MLFQGAITKEEGATMIAKEGNTIYLDAFTVRLRKENDELRRENDRLRRELTEAKNVILLFRGK